jgi:predicted acylesterase/phospholipase RssA
MSQYPLRPAAAAALLLLSFATGCSSLTFVNEPLNPADTPVNERRANHTRAALLRSSLPAEPTAAAAAPLPRDDGYFVGVAISGGGLRSANFSAAVMLELQRLGLLDKVDAISAVSGGSLTAAYYCLAPDRDWNPGNLQRKMTYRYAGDMWVQFFLPWNTFAMAFTDLDRSDLLARALQRTLFMRDGRALTFGDLRPDRPRLLVNATDLQSGRRFVFANESFDDINTDLSKYPIAYAVSASASAPVVLHQVTLRDYSTVFKQFRHFVDGGINDNLGVLSLLETYKADNELARKDNRPPPYPKGAVLIVIDAGTQFNARINDRGDVGLLGGLSFGAQLSSTRLVNRASSATLAELIVNYAPSQMTGEQIRKSLSELEGGGIIRIKDPDNHPLDIVHLALARAVGLKNAPYQNFGPSLDDIDTYFNIDPRDADNLYRAANLIVKEKFEERLVELRESLKASR